MNKEITLRQAYMTLERAQAVLIEGCAATPHLFPLDGVHNNIFLSMTWIDDCSHALDFAEGANQSVTIKDHYEMTLIDTKGNPVTFFILSKLQIV